MVMSIPFENKIQVLAKISPPLAPPRPGSPGSAVRGPVIAVEGNDSRAVAEIGKYLQGVLEREEDCEVRAWASDTYASGLGDAERKDQYLSYLREIQSWHLKSAEIKDFITSLSTPPQSASSRVGTPITRPARSPSLSPTSQPARLPQELSTSSTASARPASTDAGSNQPSRFRLPIALLPQGFSLTHADTAAASIPINDAYAPVDHWQWMATLWRGIIGADWTVYVNSHGKSSPFGDDDARRRMGANSGVEVLAEQRVIVVHLLGGQVKEGQLRRVGFEVGEFVRSIGSGGLRGL
jgi:hypothetical protein